MIVLSFSIGVFLCTICYPLCDRSCHKPFQTVIVPARQTGSVPRSRFDLNWIPNDRWTPQKVEERPRSHCQFEWINNRPRGQFWGCMGATQKASPSSIRAYPYYYDPPNGKPFDPVMLHRRGPLLKPYNESQHTHTHIPAICFVPWMYLLILLGGGGKLGLTMAL